MPRPATLILASILSASAFIVGACSTGATGDSDANLGAEAGSAPRNQRPVPDIVGMTLNKACQEMLDKGYQGGIAEVERGPDAAPARVTHVRTRPGTHGRKGQVIMMDVVGDVSLEELPSGCVDRTDPAH